MDEMWKDIPGLEGRYQASTLGRIRSLDVAFKCGMGGIMKRAGKIKVPCLNQGGYYMMDFGKFSTKIVHRLIAKTFLPNPENKKTVNHRNGIKTDNRVENLEWSTQAENTLHACQNGLMAGFKHGHRKIDRVGLKVIREAIAAGYGIRAIGRYFGITHKSVSAIRDRQSYKYV